MLGSAQKRGEARTGVEARKRQQSIEPLRPTSAAVSQSPISA
jgi:hypothetical protein